MPYFAQKFAEAGFIAITIDFSLNVLADREKGWFDMERFRRNTVSQEISEVHQVITYLQTLDEEQLTDWNGEIYLFGHSLGGAISIVVAENEPSVKRIATICSIEDIDRYNIRQKEKWFALGKKEFTDTHTGQVIILDVDFLKYRLTYVGNKALTTILSRLKQPICILHTAADATVNPKAATILYNAATNPNSIMKIIPNGNHLLNAGHPFSNTNPVIEEVLSNSINFFRKKNI
jgi:pimeloyl-ACP methyl ester carboxylesterase